MMINTYSQYAWRLLGGAAAALALTAATAAEPGAVKIGFITDMSGLYSDSDGKGGLEAIKMAVSDFGGKLNGKPIEVISADHQNKADIASAKAREWIDRENITLIVGGSNSAAGLAVNKVAAEKKVPYINVSAATDELTNEQCTPYTVHYAYDTMALAKGLGSAVMKMGGKSWFFLTADYAFGKAMEKNARTVVEARGGKVLGAAKHPLSATDFSSFMMQAQASRAQVLALANAGGDTSNSIKAAREFGLNKTMRIAPLQVHLTDLHSLGLETAQDMLVVDHWYWDLNDGTRQWSKRFFDKVKRMPTALQAADYSATMTYLKAVQAAGTTTADKVMEQLKKEKIDDFYAKGHIRGDGLMVHDVYLLQVKKPSESKYPWDYYKVLETIPGDSAFGTKQESRCTLWK